MGNGSDVISNKVYTADTQGTLDLHSKLLLALPEYQPPRGGFPGGVLRLLSATYLMFASGKVVINGVRDEPDELDFELTTNIRLYNVKLSHCSGHLKAGKLNLPNMRKKISGSIYEPELHPGLMFKIEKVSVIAYHTGAIMFCGCRSVEHAYKIKADILELINMCD